MNLTVDQEVRMPGIKDRVRAFIIENFYLDAEAMRFGDADSLVERRIVDSTGYMELITYLEDAFSGVVEDAEMVPENLDSLQAIEAFIARKQARSVPHA